MSIPPRRDHDHAPDQARARASGAQGRSPRPKGRKTVAPRAASAAPRSLFARVRDWMTEDADVAPAPRRSGPRRRRPAAAPRRVRHFIARRSPSGLLRFVDAASTAASKPRSAPAASASDSQSPAFHATQGAGAGTPRPPARVAQRRRPAPTRFSVSWLLAGAAVLASLAVGAAVAVLVIRPPHAIPTISRSQAAGAAAKGHTAVPASPAKAAASTSLTTGSSTRASVSAASSSTSASTSTAPAATPPIQSKTARTLPVATTPSGAPNCTPLGMRPVDAAASGAAIPGLCYSLGNGQNWLVGCASGFQSACDPALPSEISCLKQVGLQRRGPMTLADVASCAEKVAGAAPRTP